MRSGFKLNFSMGLLLLLGLVQADPDPLQDYCVADTNGPTPVYMNGPPCLDPELAFPSHFATSALSKPGNTSANSFGFSVILTNTQNLPGHHTQGLTMGRIDIAPNGLVPPHSHPRASEVTICLMGEILVGFVDTSNRQYTQQLRPAFTSKPPLPDEVLEKAFKITGQDIARIRRNLGG
ncbi:hypothetical protein Ancab_020606 [Ancistrocladus abbreviatus]